MSTYLVTWNADYPGDWTPKKVKELAQRTARHEQIDDWWNVANRRVAFGDRLFLMKQGSEPRGIMAAGWATSGVSKRKHWIDENKVVQYVHAIWDTVLDPWAELLLQLNDELPDVSWSTRSSGIIIEPNAAERIEEYWYRHLEKTRWSSLNPSDD